MLKRRLVFLCMGAVIASASMVLAETVPLTPGHYDVMVSGMPGGGSESRDRCVTAEHLVDPEGVFAYAFVRKYEPLPGRKVLNYSAQGGKISYDVETSMAMTHVEGTASSSEFSVVRDTKSKSGKGMPMTMKLDGKRAGKCRKHE